MSHSTSPAAQPAVGGSTSGSRRILLTGVTGFLGQAVLRSLLETTEHVHVTAVVRPKGSVTGRRRLEQLLRNIETATADDIHRFRPPDDDVRRAAVLILLSEGPDGPDVLLTERASRMRAHSGQVSFPGGSIDPEDADEYAAALREARE